MKVLSTSLCFGLLPLLSVAILLECVRGRPYLAEGDEWFPDKEEMNHEELLLALLNKIFDFQRPSKKVVEVDHKLEEFNEIEKLKRQLTNTKQAEISYAINGLSLPHPNKRAFCLHYKEHMVSNVTTAAEELAFGNTVSKAYSLDSER